jgi:hypothetical protein
LLQDLGIEVIEPAVYFLYSHSRFQGFMFLSFTRLRVCCLLIFLCHNLVWKEKTTNDYSLVSSKHSLILKSWKIPTENAGSGKYGSSGFLSTAGKRGMRLDFPFTDLW